MMDTLVLLPMVGLPLLGALTLFGLGDSYSRFGRALALHTTFVTFALSLFLWSSFDQGVADYQFIRVFFEFFPEEILYNLGGYVGVDGLSLLFLVLNCFLMPLCILGSPDLPKSNYYFGCFLALEGLVNAVFVVTNLLAFYVAFELVLVPMFFLIGVWGSRQRKVRAAYFFFLYTLAGSLMMLRAIGLLYREMGTLDMRLLTQMQGTLTESQEQWIWLAFFVSFAVKVPMVPVHIWLPEAHVEAPTAGSVILAGILLKLGTYGLLRVSLPLFPVATAFFTPRVYTLAVIAVIYTSLTAIRQTDMKRIIAYASVAHMNVTLLGLFSLTVEGIEGAILQILSHGLVAGALFFCVGVLYDRHHTRLVQYYGGVATTMPVFATVFRFFTMANIALPGTSSFVGEFRILLGVFEVNTFAALGGCTGMVLGGAYSLWLYNRVAYGNLKNSYLPVSVDLTLREMVVFAPLVVMTLVMGIYPQPFLAVMHANVVDLVETSNYYISVR